MEGPSDQTWHKTACILCESNCGIEVRLDGRRFARIRGNKDHVSSKGYTCEKALRLDSYQNHRARLTSPMRRRPDGSYEEVDWDTAIAEVAERLAAVRDAYGGATIFRYGGGGQGNHLGGMYGASVANALGVQYRSNAIAQEKTGEAFVEARLYRAHTRADFEHAEVAVFLGKNPWQSHGFPEARRILRAIANDGDRAMIVIDPRRTKTAELADHHLAVRPGTDAFCVAAILAIMVRDDLIDHDFLAEHVEEIESVLDVVREVSISDFSARCGIDVPELETVAHRIGRASSVAIFEDLGVQQGPNSTLVSYLQRLIWILRGSFAKPGSIHPHSAFAPLLSSGGMGGDTGGRRSRPKVTPVTGAPIIAGLIPCNSIAEEVLTDHPDRFRAMIIESANPVHSLADSPRFREAMDALEFSVVIDVAMTETARRADYVLPASSQYEKPEAVFFNFEFPDNVFYLRKPVLSPTPGTLSEPEIHARLAEALGAYTSDDLAPLQAAAESGRAEFAAAFFVAVEAKPSLAGVGAAVLYRTLGPTLPEGCAEGAALWFVAHRCAGAYPEAVRRAGIEPNGAGLGDALFDKVIASDDGVVFTSHLHEEAWDLLGSADNKIHANIPQLVEMLRALPDAPTGHTTSEFPLVLSAGERRSSTANTIFRDPGWRKADQEGALAMCSADAAAHGLVDGDRVRLLTAAGSAEPTVRVDDAMQPGHISLPNGLGLDYPDENGEHFRSGVSPNELTSLGWQDEIALTPWHKHVPARLEPV
ncbi:MAG: molybdopterin-dependent oxidoreductase [Acidimicrobiaceae bacterium]|nr:molybdopterin-dependent oxidoreductase [Acidimicrobiaceae bacterium]MYF42161.1 molybdopterin-dependent oxidoreductase [Acidimicrobiaceae bacterium]MYJ34684.1 molybdopterin-dependent oxidoreductase [Acidimicrobiaceae bacterium]